MVSEAGSAVKEQSLQRRNLTPARVLQARKCGKLSLVTHSVNIKTNSIGLHETAPNTAVTTEEHVSLHDLTAEHGNEAGSIWIICKRPTPNAKAGIDFLVRLLTLEQTGWVRDEDVGTYIDKVKGGEKRMDAAPFMDELQKKGKKKKPFAEESALLLKQVAKLKMAQAKEGAPVTVYFSDKESWYNGTITAVNRDRTFTVHIDLSLRHAHAPPPQTH